MLKSILRFLIILILLPVILIFFVLYKFIPKKYIPKKLLFTIFAQQAQIARQHYLRTGNRNSLDKAIVAMEYILQHPEFDKININNQLIALNNTALMYVSRYREKDQLSDLNTALYTLKIVVAQTSPQHQDFCIRVNNLTILIEERYSRLKELTDLQSGIEVYQQAITNSPPNFPDLPMWFDNLGSGLMERYSRLGELTDLQVAICAHQQAIEKAPSNCLNLNKYLHNLSFGLRKHYLHLGDLTALQQAIETQEQAIKKTPTDSPDLPERLNLLGYELQDRYFHLGKLTDIQAGIIAFQQAIEKTPLSSPNLPIYLNNLGSVLVDIYGHSGELTDLQQAIDAYQQSIDKTPSNSSNLPCFLNNFGVGLNKRYSHLGNLMDLQAGIIACQQAIEKTPLSSPNLPIYLNCLGSGLKDRYLHLGELTDLQQAIELYQQAIEKTPSDDTTNLPIYFNNLGSGLIDRYSCLGELDDLQTGINAYQQAIEKTSPNSPNLPVLLNNLGIGLNKCYSRLRELTDLQQAIETYQQAIEKNHSDSYNTLKILNNLGVALTERHSCLGELEDLQAGIRAFQQAITNTSPDSPDLPSWLNNLGNGLTDRYSRLGELADLQAGIKAYQQSIANTQPNSPNLPLWLNNLGTGLCKCYLHLGELTDLQAGIDAFQQAVILGEKHSIEVWLRSARNWLNWAFERNSWAEIEEAYPAFQKASKQLVEKQLLREHQEAFLRDTQDIAVKVAYARIQTEQLAGAVETLEQGVARLLSSALARSDTDLTQLQQDNLELYERYQQQLQAVNNAQQFYQNAPENLREKVRSDWQTQEKQFNELVAEIRQLQGHENFLLIATDINTVKQVSQQALIYIFSTEKGGYALNVFRGEIQAIALPKLTDTTLLEKIISYFKAYSERGENWFNAIDAMTTWLYQAIMQPILQNIPKQAQITLIPIGALNLLPLHAAAYSTADNQRRYVLDDYTISYAPNALSLQTARKRAELPAQKLLAINEPRPVKANDLLSCTTEIQAIQKHFAQSDIFAHENATQENVKNALKNDYSVLHFSCHGGAEITDPLKTGLLMANNEMLTVQDFLNAKLNARLVSLSACETGIIGIKQMEEVVGLPTSLLQAGVAGVVASLWSVADLSTMLLMAQFYHRWLNEYPDNPAEALRLAQIWVRDAKPREKTEFLKTFLPENEAKAIREKMGASDYSHPFFWAAFNYTGI